MKNTVIHHSADADGIFCREIARKFLPDAELIGWDFGDPPIKIDSLMDPARKIYVMDLPVDRVFGFNYRICQNQPFVDPSIFVWIDHHRTAIESHPKEIPGYRIDGVAACRLAWQWFAKGKNGYPWTSLIDWPEKQHFVRREVEEPFAVRLAGEFDIWDKRDPNAELFQHGLRSEDIKWSEIWNSDENPNENTYVAHLLEQGRALQYAKTQENASIIKNIGFDLEWEGLKFLACNHAQFNSFLFTAGIKPEHDALIGFKWTGKDWNVSLYHAPGKEHHDLSLIAVKHGGGGHRGACGMRMAELPWI